jgi:hypothetical protein
MFSIVSPASVCPVVSLNLVVIGLLYMAYPDGSQHKFTFLPRLRPYPMRGHRLLCILRSVSFCTLLQPRHLVCHLHMAFAEAAHDACHAPYHTSDQHISC